MPLVKAHFVGNDVLAPDSIKTTRPRGETPPRLVIKVEVWLESAAWRLMLQPTDHLAEEELLPVFKIRFNRILKCKKLWAKHFACTSRHFTCSRNRFTENWHFLSRVWKSQILVVEKAFTRLFFLSFLHRPQKKSIFHETHKYRDVRANILFKFFWHVKICSDKKSYPSAMPRARGPTHENLATGHELPRAHACSSASFLSGW